MAGKLRSIFWKFLAILIPSVSVAALLVLVLFAYLRYTELENDLLTKIELLSQVHGLAVAEPLWTLNIESLERSVQTITINPEIICAEVLETDRKPIFSWPENCKGESNNEYHFTRDLEFHGEVVGTLRLNYTRSLILSSLVRDVAIGALLFFTLVLVTSVVAFIAVKLIVGKPLSLLLDSIHAAEKGEVRREVDWSSVDELGRVIDAYNGMIKQVDQHNLELEASREQAEMATRLKSNFLANMSHELRTPLNAVIGITEMMREEATDEGRDTEPYQRVSRAGKHLLSLIDNILDLSKIEANKLELSIAEVDPQKLLQEVVTTVKPLAEKNGNRFEFVSEELPEFIKTDAVRLRQVLLNILGNACKFTKNGVVRFEVETDIKPTKTRLTFSIIDNGIGIPELQIPLLFNDFAQTTGGRKSEYGGTGLGLAISQRICRLMNSEIQLRSKEGAGTTFSFVLEV